METLVYERSGINGEMAENINRELAEAGFKNLGVKERPGLVVLRRTKMPAVLVEAGFINNGEDNRVFVENFKEMAQAIADGILKTIYTQEVEAYEYEEGEKADRYRIQTGYFTLEENARALQAQMMLMGYQAEILKEQGAFRVVTGDFENLDNAAKMEQALREHNFNTYIITQ